METLLGKTQRNELFYSDLDDSLGSTGFNYYQGQMVVENDDPYNINYRSRVPSVYLNPQRYGYGRMIYLSHVQNNMGYDETCHIPQKQPKKNYKKVTIVEGQWKNNYLDGYGRIIDQKGNCYIGELKKGMR